MAHRPDRVIACPSCGTLARWPQGQQGPAFGARVWTDGRLVAPMQPDVPTATRCPRCATFYWLAEAPQQGLVRFGDPHAPEAWLNAPPTLGLDAHGALEALASGLADTPQKARHLRQLAWHRDNDATRSVVPAGRPEALTPTQRQANLEALLELIDSLETASDLDRLVRGELLRAMGRFDEAQSGLEGDWPSSLKPVAAFIKALAKEGRRETAEVKR